jgi:hypothetical protein
MSDAHKYRKVHAQCALTVEVRPVKAFYRGFMSGLAAPVLLFAHIPLEAPRHVDRNLNSWKEVSSAMRSAFKDLERERKELADRL